MLRLGILSILTTLLPGAQAQPGDVDVAFQKFWTAKSPAEAGKPADEAVKAGVLFDDAWKRLVQGRKYTAQESGVVQLKNQTEDGVEHYFAVTVPPGYDPARRYQVRFQLHGGVDGPTDNKPRGTGEIGVLAGAEQFYVIPYAWKQAPWWGDDQVLNLNAIVDTLKRTYNIDENRVVLSGFSDGATGSYFIAMRDTTPFASFLPLNGYIMVLGSDDIKDGRIFPNNLRNKPMFVVNGGRDRLFPIATVEPFTRHLISGGVNITYHPLPEGEHNTKYWPEVKNSFENFVTDHPRDPHPDKLTWEAADSIHNRAHWLVLDEFGPAQGEAKDLPDLNLAGSQALFEKSKNAGRVDLVRTGNTVEVSTRNVTAFTLLLSPDKLDFSRPVKVMANGRKVFNGKVERDVKTLLKWAAKDNDRTMLYAAELKIKLP
jgi:pimeloyl-ACP methyl ester carboxylesterase